MYIQVKVQKKSFYQATLVTLVNGIPIDLFVYKKLIEMYGRQPLTFMMITSNTNILSKEILVLRLKKVIIVIVIP